MSESETSSKETDCVLCDRVWLAAGILAALGVGILAADMFTGGRLSAWVSERISPKLGQLFVLDGGKAEGEGTDDSGAA